MNAAAKFAGYCLSLGRTRANAAVAATTIQRRIWDIQDLQEEDRNSKIESRILLVKYCRRLLRLDRTFVRERANVREAAAVALQTCAVYRPLEGTTPHITFLY